MKPDRAFVLSLAFLSVMYAGCERSPSLPSDGHESTSSFNPGGYAEALSRQVFNELPPEDRYAVASKLMATMYKGVGAEAFFDLSGGDLSVRQSDFLNETRTALGTALDDSERARINAEIDGLDENNNSVPDAAKYVFDEDRPRQLPLARIYEYPVSRDAFIEWMAYFLVNTIMFSPALEMESTGIGDVQNTFRSLVSAMTEGRTVRQIVRSHLPTVARWRVSRSPENHALEAYELYLGLFETEEDSRRGGIACKEWFLTDEDEGYQLVRSDEINTEPQVVLEDYFVTTCDDLYDVIAGHPLLMPRVTEVIVNYLMAGREAEDRLRMVESIVAGGAETFEDIFIGVLFSREYLLNTERVKGFEENALPLLARFNWDARDEGVNGDIDEDVFRNMASRRRTFSQVHMNEMGWNTMSYKIGRLPNVPTDALSFANHHKAIRERVLMDEDAYRRNLLYENYDDGENRRLAAPFLGMSPDDYLDYLFLTALQRLPEDDERDDLMTLFSPTEDNLYILEDRDGVMLVREGRHDDMARITFDYISRLPEFYYFRAID